MGKKVEIEIIGLTDPGGSGGPTFKNPLNPATLKHNRSLEILDKKVGDTAGPVSQFQSYGAETLDIELVIDGTDYDMDISTGSPKPKNYVADKVKELTGIVYEYQGSIHKPYYLLLKWQQNKFRGQASSYDVDFTLFDMEGNPLRAKVKFSVTGYRDPDTNRSPMRSSPDMTHVKTVRVGDSLPLMCKEVYGKMNYYLQVAEHNGLTNFRELEVGETLEFPPLER